MLPSCEWDLWSTRARLVVTDPAALDDARDLCDGVLGEVDRAANRFDPTSELSRLPTDGEPVQVSRLLAQLVLEARTAAMRTDGAVDPTVGGFLEALGYDRDIELVRRDGAGPHDVTALRAVVRTVPAWHRIRVLSDTLMLPPGVRLDLGATAKASAADRCAQTVARRLGVGVLVGLGGDIATAGPGPDNGWQVTVHDRPQDHPEQVTLAAGAAIATSSTRARVWWQGDTRRHHIVHPGTGLSADTPWACVTAVAPTALEANTLTTAAVVKGGDAPRWLRAQGRPVRLLGHDGGVRTVGDWPVDRFTEPSTQVA